MSKPDLGRIIAQTMAPPADGRTIETITKDILEAQRRGGEAVLTIGRCLIEADVYKRQARRHSGPPPHPGGAGASGAGHRGILR